MTEWFWIVLTFFPSLSSSAGSTAPGCTYPDVLIRIIKPTMKDIFDNRKGELICEATVLKPSLTKIWWEDESSNVLVTSNINNGKSIVTLPLDITYDEWSQGITRNCFVEHSEWLQPRKESYDRYAGKNLSIFLLHLCRCSCLTIVSHFQEDRFCNRRCFCCLR